MKYMERKKFTGNIKNVNNVIKINTDDVKESFYWKISGNHPFIKSFDTIQILNSIITNNSTKIAYLLSKIGFH